LPRRNRGIKVYPSNGMGAAV